MLEGLPVWVVIRLCIDWDKFQFLPLTGYVVVRFTNLNNNAQIANTNTFRYLLVGCTSEIGSSYEQLQSTSLQL